MSNYLQKRVIIIIRTHEHTKSRKYKQMVMEQINLSFVLFAMQHNCAHTEKLNKKLSVFKKSHEMSIISMFCVFYWTPKRG